MKTRTLKTCLDTAFKNNNPLKHPQWECYKHYTFLLQKNQIISWGTNRAGDPLTYLGYEPYQKIHSEVDAYKKGRSLLKRGESFEVVNIRLTKTGMIRDSNPCKCCFSFLKNLGCKRIWFSTDVGSFASMI